MEKLKICLIIPNVLPVPATKGGATEMLMTNLLKENEKSGLIDFTCVSVYEEEAEKLSRDYKYTKFIYINQKRENLDLKFETGDSFFKPYMDEFYEKIKNEDFDFIVIEGGDVSGYKYILDKFPKEKRIVHIHGNPFGDNKINNEVYHKFLGISKYTCKLISSDGNIPPEKVELLYNAINTSDFDKTISEEEKDEIRKKYGIEKNDNVIIFFGRTIPEKGIKELITAFKKIKNLNNSKLLIVGCANYGERVKTPFDYELEKLAESIQDKIKFTGYINNNELYKVHNISDIAVIPSMWEELFGLVVVEAMSSGLPLIVTNSGGIPEIVDSECAYIIDKDEKLIDNMAEKLDYLIEHPEIREKMGKHAKIRAKKFDMKEYLINFNNVMNKIKNEEK